MTKLVDRAKYFMMLTSKRRKRPWNPVYPRKKKKKPQQQQALPYRSIQNSELQKKRALISTTTSRTEGTDEDVSISSRREMLEKLKQEQDQPRQYMTEQQQRQKENDELDAESSECCSRKRTQQLPEKPSSSTLSSVSAVTSLHNIDERLCAFEPCQTGCSESTASFQSHSVAGQVSCMSTCNQTFHLPTSSSRILYTPNLPYSPSSCLDYFEPNVLSEYSFYQSGELSSELNSKYYTPLLLYLSDEDGEERSTFDSSFSSPSLSSWQEHTENQPAEHIHRYSQTLTQPIPGDQTLRNEPSCFLNISSFGLLLAPDREAQVCLDLHEEAASALRERELQLPLLYGYMEKNASEIIQENRQLIVNWQIQHAATSFFRPETLFRAVNLMDRCLYYSSFKPESLPLLGMACMAIAAKLEETQPFWALRDACSIGTKCFTCYQLIHMEKLVLKILNYECSVPTTGTFMGQYLMDLKGNLEFEVVAKYISYLSLTDYEILHFYPSIIAASCVFLACQIQKAFPPTTAMLEHWTGRSTDALTTCVKRLEWLHKQIIQQQRVNST